MWEFTIDEICNEVLVLKSTRSENTFFRYIMSFPFQAVTVGLVYLAGYFSLSPAWLLAPLFLSVLRDRCRVEKELAQRVAMAESVWNDNRLIFARIDKLPPWLIFPDVDQCEWFNIMVSQFWPTYTCYLVDLIEQKMRNIKEEYPAFSFQFNFGSVPPRVSGVKVYEKIINRNEIMVDLNVYYAGDCDFSFVVYGLSGGIKNVQLCGLLRLHMKPLSKVLPLIGGIEVYFLGKPTVDFNWAGVLSLLTLPGLNDVIHRKINEFFYSEMVMPNRLSFSWSHFTYNFMTNFPIPVGVLRINVVEAEDLLDCYEDGPFGAAQHFDPFVTVSLGPQQFTSERNSDLTNPKWDFWAEFIVDYMYKEAILFEVTKGNENVGVLEITLDTVKDKGIIDKLYYLDKIELGKIRLCLFYFQLSSDNSDYYKLANKRPFLSSAVLIIYIDSAHQLENYKSGEEPDTVACFTVGNITEKSKTVFCNRNPVFQQGFMFLVNNPELDKIYIKLVDNKDGVELGDMSFNIWKLFYRKPMEVISKRFSLLNTSSESSIILSLRLKTLHKTVPNRSKNQSHLAKKAGH